MASLFILGNGFDRAHGLETDYMSFRKFLVSMSMSQADLPMMSETFISTLNKAKTSLNKKNVIIEALIEKLSVEVIERRICRIMPIHEDFNKIINWAKFDTNDFNKDILHSSYSMEIIKTIKSAEMPFSRDFILSNQDVIWNSFYEFFSQYCLRKQILI